MEARRININEISAHPDNPRQNIDTTGIVDSVREHGIMQPLTLIPGSEKEGSGKCRFCAQTVVKLNSGVLSEHDGDGFRCPGSQEHAGDRYLVLAGHRRLTAARECGLDTVPAVIRPDLAGKALQMMLVENLQRADLTMSEEAEAYEQLSLLGVEDWVIAKWVGVQRARVAKTRRVLGLSKTMQARVNRHQITLDEALLTVNRHREARERIEQSESLSEARYEAALSEGQTPAQAARETRDLFVADLIQSRPRKATQNKIIEAAIHALATGQAVTLNELPALPWQTALRALQAIYEGEPPHQEWSDLLTRLAYEPPTKGS